MFSKTYQKFLVFSCITNGLCDILRAVTPSKICNSKYCTSTCTNDSQSGEVQNTYCKSYKILKVSLESCFESKEIFLNRFKKKMILLSKFSKEADIC